MKIVILSPRGERRYIRCYFLINGKRGKLLIILTVAYFYEQLRRAEGGIGGWGGGVFKNNSLFYLRSRKKFLID